MARLIALEGIGEMYAVAFARAGVSTVEQLLDAGGSPEARRDLAERTGLTAQQVLEWVNRADLMRINGIGSEYSDLLEASGVDTVRALATCRAETLASTLQETNAVKKLVRRTPSQAEVEKWIEGAKMLPALVAVPSADEGMPLGHDRIEMSHHDKPSAARAVIAELEAVLPNEGEAALAVTQFAFRRAMLDLVSEAAATFGGIEEGLAWLKSPNRSIGGATPESLLDKGLDGVGEARGILFRLEEGMFS